MQYRAIMSDTLGPPEVYSLRDFHPGEPGPGEALIRIHAAGVTFVDILMSSGKYQVQPSLPCIPGIECAGIVEAIGEGVTDVSVGDRVLSGRADGQYFADYAISPADKLYRIPDVMSFAQGAAFKINYTTAYRALAQRGSVQPGETVLVLGAGGGVGYASVQIAKALGATVIASASSEEKRELAQRGGADAVIDTCSDNWRADVKAAAGGKPVDVVVDPVGGALTVQAFKCLGYQGRHLMIGFAAGDIPNLPANLPLLKEASLVGVNVAVFGTIEKAAADDNLALLLDWVADGRLMPPVGRTYSLDQFADAMEDVATGQTVGRVVIDMMD